MIKVIEICERCGKEVQQTMSGTLNHTQSNKTMLTNITAGAFSLFVCSECMRLFTEWVKVSKGK